MNAVRIFYAKIPSKIIMALMNTMNFIHFTLINNRYSKAMSVYILKSLICTVAWKLWEVYTREKAKKKQKMIVITGTSGELKQKYVLCLL